MTSLSFNEHINQHRASFPGPQLELVLASIAAGNTAGQLWKLPQPNAPPILVLWDQGNNVVYLAGESDRGSLVDSLVDLVSSRICRESLAAGRSYFKVRTLCSSLEEQLPRVFAGITLRASPTLFYKYLSNQPPPIVRPAAPDIALMPITPTVLIPRRYAGSEYVLEEIGGMWSTEERFYERGFGTIAVLQNEIICWCTAEYLSPTRCGIGIATAPQYRGRGVATATAAHFIQQAQERGMTPYWECARSNVASARVAEKAGFVCEAEETY